MRVRVETLDKDPLRGFAERRLDDIEDARTVAVGFGPDDHARTIAYAPGAT